MPDNAFRLRADVGSIYLACRDAHPPAWPSSAR